MKKKHLIKIILLFGILFLGAFLFIIREKSWQKLFQHLDSEIRSDWKFEKSDKNRYQLWNENYQLDFEITQKFIKGYTYKVNDDFQYAFSLLCALVDERNHVQPNRFFDFLHSDFSLFQEDLHHISVSFTEENGVYFQISLNEISPISIEDAKIFHANAVNYWYKQLYEPLESAFSYKDYYYHILIQDEENQKTIYFGEKDQITGNVVEYVKEFIGLYFNGNMAEDYFYFFSKNQFYECTEFRVEKVSNQAERLFSDYEYLKFTRFGEILN